MKRNMENKEEKEEIQRQESEEDNLDVRLVKLSSTFSKNSYIFYSSLRWMNSILITSTTLWYTHYYLIRKDENKTYSYFTKKPKKSLFDANNMNMSSLSSPDIEWNFMTKSNEHIVLWKLTIGSLIFHLTSNILLKLQKKSLTKLLNKIKLSHIIRRKKKQALDGLSSSSNDDSKEDEELRELEKKKIYLKQSDLQLLDKWKVLLGGIKYWFGGVQTATLYMIICSLISETTMFDWCQNRARKQQYDKMQDSLSNIEDKQGMMQRFYQYTNDTQEIEWPEHVKSGDVATPMDFKPLDLQYLSTFTSQMYLVNAIIPSFLLCYTEFPAATLWYVYLIILIILIIFDRKFL